MKNPERPQGFDIISTWWDDPDIGDRRVVSGNEWLDSAHIHDLLHLLCSSGYSSDGYQAPQLTIVTLPPIAEFANDHIPMPELADYLRASSERSKVFLGLLDPYQTKTLIEDGKKAKFDANRLLKSYRSRGQKKSSVFFEKLFAIGSKATDVPLNIHEFVKTAVIFGLPLHVHENHFVTGFLVSRGIDLYDWDFYYIDSMPSDQFVFQQDEMNGLKTSITAMVKYLAGNKARVYFHATCSSVQPDGFNCGIYQGYTLYMFFKNCLENELAIDEHLLTISEEFRAVAAGKQGGVQSPFQWSMTYKASSSDDVWRRDALVELLGIDTAGHDTALAVKLREMIREQTHTSHRETPPTYFIEKYLRHPPNSAEIGKMLYRREELVMKSSEKAQSAGWSKPASRSKSAVKSRAFVKEEKAMSSCARASLFSVLSSEDSESDGESTGVGDVEVDHDDHVEDDQLDGVENPKPTSAEQRELETGNCIDVDRDMAAQSDTSESGEKDDKEDEGPQFDESTGRLKIPQKFQEIITPLMRERFDAKFRSTKMTMSIIELLEARPTNLKGLVDCDFDALWAMRDRADENGQLQNFSEVDYLMAAARRNSSVVNKVLRGWATFQRRVSSRRKKLVRSYRVGKGGVTWKLPDQRSRRNLSRAQRPVDRGSSSSSGEEGDQGRGRRAVTSVQTKMKVLHSEDLLAMALMAHYNQSGHGGTKSSFYTTTRTYYNLTRSMMEYVIDKLCPVCHTVKGKGAIKQQVDQTKIIESSYAFERIVIDLVDMEAKFGPGAREVLPDGSQGRIVRYVLHARDHWSKFCWLEALQSKSMREVCHHMLKTFQRHGPPAILQSDNGKEFCNRLIKTLANEFNIHLVHGRPKHPQSQGLVERGNAIFVEKVKSLLAEEHLKYQQAVQEAQDRGDMAGVVKLRQSSWVDVLGKAEFMLNTTVSRTHGKTPMDVLRRSVSPPVVHGRNIVLDEYSRYDPESGVHVVDVTDKGIIVDDTIIHENGQDDDQAHVVEEGEKDGDGDVKMPTSPGRAGSDCDELGDEDGQDTASGVAQDAVMDGVGMDSAVAKEEMHKKIGRAGTSGEKVCEDGNAEVLQQDQEARDQGLVNDEVPATKLTVEKGQEAAVNASLQRYNKGRLRQQATVNAQVCQMFQVLAKVSFELPPEDRAFSPFRRGLGVIWRIRIGNKHITAPPSTGVDPNDIGKASFDLLTTYGKLATGLGVNALHLLPDSVPVGLGKLDENMDLKVMREMCDSAPTLTMRKYCSRMQPFDGVSDESVLITKPMIFKGCSCKGRCLNRSQCICRKNGLDCTVYCKNHNSDSVKCKNHTGRVPPNHEMMVLRDESGTLKQVKRGQVEE